MATFREQVATEIRALLARRGISVAQLARHLGVNQKWLANRIPQRAGTPVVYALDTDALARIAAYLEVPVADLMPPGVPSDEPTGSPNAPDREGRVLRFKPADPAPDSTYYLPTPKEPLVKARSSELTRPPSVPKSTKINRATGPASRRPRVNARLAGSRS